MELGLKKDYFNPKIGINRKEFIIGVLALYFINRIIQLNGLVVLLEKFPDNLLLVILISTLLWIVIAVLTMIFYIKRSINAGVTPFLSIIKLLIIFYLFYVGILYNYFGINLGVEDILVSYMPFISIYLNIFVFLLFIALPEKNLNSD